MSGKDTNRPRPEGMMDFVREGDTVIVESFYNHKRPRSSIGNQTPVQAEEIYFKKTKRSQHFYRLRSFCVQKMMCVQS